MTSGQRKRFESQKVELARKIAISTKYNPQIKQELKQEPLQQGNSATGSPPNSW
jgi:hypothetical protein